MKRISLLAVFFAGVLASGLFAAERPNTLDLSGREVVVRVYRGSSQEQMEEYQRATLVIERRTIRFDLEDANDSTLFKILAEDQKDQLVRQVIGEGGFSWRYQQGTGFYLPISAAELDGRVAVVQVCKNRKPDVHDLREVMTKGRTIKFDFTDLNEASRVYVFGRDQKDEVIRLVTSERHFSHAYAKGLEYSLPTTLSELGGREVVVRVYKDWRQDPRAYEKALAKVYGRTVRLAFEDADESAVVAIFGEDQRDELLKKRIGYRAYGWAYKPGLRFSLPDEVSPEPNDFYWTFVDALDNLLQGATVELYLHHRNWRVLVDKGVVDDTGQWKTRFQVRASNISLDGSECHLFVVSHRDYGAADVKIHQTEFRYHVIILPFIPADSKAYERCAWGVVVDPNKNPVSGATVEASSLRVRGVDWWGSAARSCVRTDKQGRFRVYMPVNPWNEAIGPLIPPKSEYRIRVEPPKKLGLTVYKGTIPTGQASVITLARPSDYFHTFAFEDQNGPITDRRILDLTGIIIRRKSTHDVNFVYREWEDGGLFPLGTFKVHIPAWACGREYAFEPVEVTADSPEHIVFKPSVSPPKLYYGRVIHGVTGEPMEGVSVRDLTKNPSTLGEKRDASKKTRSDEAGRFELKRPDHLRAREIKIYEPNYLTILIKNGLFKEDPEGNFELPLTRMFPAARVVVEPWMDKTSLKRQRHHGYPSLEHELIVDVNNNPPWAKDFLTATAGIDDFQDRYHRGRRLDTNDGPESFYVPAGLNLQLQLRPTDKQWSPITIAKNTKLQQGEVLDLGRVEIQRALTIFVDVTNLAGEPVEGVPVTACDQYGRTTSYTDENGVAIFSLAHDSKGKFVVECELEVANMTPLREAIAYEINGPQDANNIYTLQVSDKMLYNLFK